LRSWFSSLWDDPWGKKEGRSRERLKGIAKVGKKKPLDGKSRATLGGRGAQAAAAKLQVTAPFMRQRGTYEQKCKLKLNETVRRIKKENRAQAFHLKNPSFVLDGTAIKRKLREKGGMKKRKIVR